MRTISGTTTKGREVKAKDNKASRNNTVVQELAGSRTYSSPGLQRPTTSRCHHTPSRQLALQMVGVFVLLDEPSACGSESADSPGNLHSLAGELAPYPPNRLPSPHREWRAGPPSPRSSAEPASFLHKFYKPSPARRGLPSRPGVQRIGAVFRRRGQSPGCSQGTTWGVAVLGRPGWWDGGVA